MFSLLTQVHAVSTKSPRVDAAEPLVCVPPLRIKPKGGIKRVSVVIHEAEALIYQSACHLLLFPSLTSDCQFPVGDETNLPQCI